jgi:hypothetical protein
MVQHLPREKGLARLPPALHSEGGGVVVVGCVCVCVFCWNVHALWLRSFSLFSSSSSRHHFSDPHGQRFSPSHTHTPLFSSSKFALGYTCNDYRNLILYLEKGNERKGK